MSIYKTHRNPKMFNMMYTFHSLCKEEVKLVKLIRIPSCKGHTCYFFFFFNFFFICSEFCHTLE